MIPLLLFTHFKYKARMPSLFLLCFVKWTVLFGCQPEPQSTTKEFIVTAYCPCSKCCAPYDDDITASGHVIQPGDKLIAAPKIIPFGTLIDIPGYGEKVPVLDRGGAIKGNRLDVLFDTHQEALIWGRKKLKCVIYCPDA